MDVLRITADDGYGLVGHVSGASNQGPVLLINGAVGVRQKYYARFAAWAAEQGATGIGVWQRLGEFAFGATMQTQQAATVVSSTTPV